MIMDTFKPPAIIFDYEITTLKPILCHPANPTPRPYHVGTQMLETLEEHFSAAANILFKFDSGAEWRGMS